MKMSSFTRKQLLLCLVCGVAGGFLNGLFGSGAGIVCVMLLRLITGDDKQAHATSTLVVLILSSFNLFLYWLGGEAELMSALHFVPGGVAGALLGAVWLKNMKTDKLRRIFGAVMAASGVVMLLS